jgi:D-psicose/D-tagatose/L-ribulose 3-epimerase
VRLSISNIAWDVAEDEEIALLLERFEIDAIDVAPMKYFPRPAEASDDAIRRVRHWWSDRGIEMTGMQSLLFGTSGLNLFGPPDVREAMLQHLAAVSRVGAGLGANRLVFGSPRNRDRAGLADDEVRDIARAFFRRLGDVADSLGVTICLEPNPTVYGASFMTTSAETAAVVVDIDHPAVKMQLDTGAMAINGEAADVVLPRFAHLIGHVHASEPQLLPLGDGTCPHDDVFVALKKYLPEHVVTVEMVATAGEPHQESVARALSSAIRHYRSDHVRVRL